MSGWLNVANIGWKSVLNISGLGGKPSPEYSPRCSTTMLLAASTHMAPVRSMSFERRRAAARSRTVMGRASVIDGLLRRYGYASHPRK